MDLNLRPENPDLLEAWQRFLAWLTQALSSLQDQPTNLTPQNATHCSERMFHVAKEAWEIEAQLLLGQLYRLSGLRTLVIARSRNFVSQSLGLPRNILRHIALFL